jgi:hypothetical protein
VKLFIEYVRTCRAFNKYAMNTVNKTVTETLVNPLEQLLALAPDRGCPLAHAAEMVQSMMAAISAGEQDRVTLRRGRVAELRQLRVAPSAGGNVRRSSKINYWKHKK